MAVLRWMAVLAMASMAWPAAGQETTVSIGELSSRCRALNSFDQGFCTGYVRALLEYRSAYDNADRTRQTYCVPPKLAGDQIRKNFVGWVGKNQDKAKLPALWGFTRSLNDGFPC